MRVAKKCTTCGKEKDRSEFYRDRSKPDGLHPKCADCHKEYARNKRKNDAEWRARCLERSKAYRQKYPNRVKSSIRWSTIKKKYGITRGEYLLMLKSQGGACAICGTKGSGTSWSENLHVDHNHETGVVRGLLCQPCNVSLGKMKNSAELLRKAAKYLEAK
jgi:hypothetical protein